MESSVLECGVCTNPFSEEHCPKILPCSHTFCCRCIEEIISNQTKACPFCREEFTASSTDDLLFNRTVLEAAKQFLSFHKEPKISSRGSGMSFGNFNNDSRENFFTKAIANCNEVTSQMMHDIFILMRMNSDILQANKVIVGLKEKLNEIEIFNKDILYTIDENIKQLKKKCDVIDEDVRRFKGYEASLKAAVSFTSAGAIMDDSIDDLHNVQAKVLEIKELLRENEQKTDDIVKEIIKMQTSVRNVAEEIGRIVEEDLPKVLAVKPLEGRHRIGTVKIGSKNRVFMSHLEEGDTQVTSCAIKESSVLECGVCTNPFSEEHCPKILPCSHTFCCRCIEEIISNQTKACPFCREEFTASSTNDLVFNRIALDAAKQFLSFDKEPKISSRGPGMSFGNFNKDLRENFIKKAIDNCNEVTSQMMRDISILMRMYSDILQADKVVVGLKEKLNEIETFNRDILYTIDENIKQLKKKCDVIDEDVRRFKGYDARLKAAEDFTSAGAIMDNSIDDLHYVQAKVLEIKELLRGNEQKTGDIVKEIIQMQTSLRNVAEEINRIVEGDLPKVLAVKLLEGRHRIGTVKIGSKNRVFMSHLEEGDTQVTSCAMKESSVLECGVCTNPFSEEHCPKILPCSHTFCCRCIEEIISNQTKACPFCREEFTASSTDDLLFNRTVLEAAKQFLPFDKEQKISSRGSGMSFGNFNKDLRENFIKKAIDNCNEVTFQMMHDIFILMRMNSDILQANKVILGLKEKLNEIEIFNKDILYTIDENIKQLKKKCDVINEDVRRFKGYDARLKAAEDFTSAGAIMDNSIDDLHNVQAKVLEIKELLRENEQKTGDIVKEIIKMQTNLRNVAEEIDKIVEEDLPKVLAVKPLEGRHRIGTVKIGSKNRVFMSHLEEGDTQVTNCAIKFESLMPKTSRRVFLDLGTDGRFLGRMIIKVIDEGNLALNFLHMCAGDLGPSYANSSIFGIGMLGDPGENVGFGDYVVEDGTTARPVLLGVDWKRESKKDIYDNTIAREGEVRGWLDHACKDVSRFYIVLKEKSGWTHRDRLGVVEEGLQVLKDAIRLYPNFREIKIVDCGHVFCF
ncbi:putative leucine-rich repeat-containing protein DDB_G0290503 isoform X3 [Palaemon carinicauda]|uniref:putative leucine-rich repeat-containing protein DDB_G0290503 isoform X3 n=1 Tax=Palaemon carinicauda TaxID=392227 RepID=UPI0035B57B20